MANVTMNGCSLNLAISKPFAAPTVIPTINAIRIAVGNHIYCCSPAAIMPVNAVLQWIGFDPTQDMRAKGVNVPLFTCYPIGDSEGNKVLVTVEFPKTNEVNRTLPPKLLDDAAPVD